MHNFGKVNRRTMITTGAAMAAISLVDTAMSQVASNAAPPEVNSDPFLVGRKPTKQVGRKWNADKTPRQFRGNTFVHHYVENDPLAQAMSEMRAELLDNDLGSLFAPLPPSTFHLTFLNGTDESQRGTNKWPSSIPADAPISEVTTLFLQALQAQKIAFPTAKVQAYDVTDITNPAKGLSVAIRLDEPSLLKIKDFQTELATTVGLDTKLIQKHSFHSTIAYRLYENYENEVSTLRRLTESFRRKLPVETTVSLCGFNTFANMLGFPELLTFQE